MAVTRLYTPRPYDSFDPAIAGVAPILATGTDVDNTKLTAVQAAATAAGLGTLPTSAGGTAPAPAAEPLRFRGAWQANTVYSYGDVVSQAGILYVAPTSFTSAGSFVAGNWTQLGLADGTSLNAAFLPVTPSNTPPANTAGLWLSNALTDVRVSPDPADRVAVVSPGAGSVAQEPQPLIVGGVLVGLYHTTNGGATKYVPVAGDPTVAASYGAATTVLGGGVGGEAGKAYHIGVYVEGSTIYLTYTDDTHINLATASTSAPATVTKQSVLLNLTDVGSPTLFGNSQIMKDGTTYYLDYDANYDNWQVGYATATTVTGPYTKVLSQGKLQSLWPGQPVAGGLYNGSPVGQGGNLHVFKENGVWVAFYHVGPKVSGSIPTDGFRATSTDRQVWTVDRGGYPLIRRAALGEVDQVADLRPAQINGNWYCWWTAYDNTASTGSVMCAPLRPVLKQSDGTYWQTIDSPADPTVSVQAAQRRAAAFLTTDGSSTSVYAVYTVILSCKFTPRTPRAMVTTSCKSSLGSVGQNAYFRATCSGGSALYNGGNMGAYTQPSGGYQVAFSGDMEFTGLTPGVEYTFNVAVAVSSGATWNCRASTLGQQEALSMTVEDVLYPPSRLALA